MKLENKLGIYAIAAIILAIAGFIIMVYPFEYYSDLDAVTGESVGLNLMITVFGTKAIGVLLLYISSGIYHKHFK